MIKLTATSLLLLSTLSFAQVGTKGGGGSLVFSFKQASYNMAKVVESKKKLYESDNLNPFQTKLSNFYSTHRKEWIETLLRFNSEAAIIQKSPEALEEDGVPVEAKVDPVINPTKVLLNTKLIYETNSLSTLQWMSLSFHEASHFIIKVNDKATHSLFDQISSILLKDYKSNYFTNKKVALNSFERLITLSSDSRTLVTAHQGKAFTTDLVSGIRESFELPTNTPIYAKLQNYIFFVHPHNTDVMKIWDIRTGLFHIIDVPEADYGCISCYEVSINEDTITFTGYNLQTNTTHIIDYNIVLKSQTTKDVSGKWGLSKNQNFLTSYNHESNTFMVFDLKKNEIVYFKRNKGVNTAKLPFISHAGLIISNHNKGKAFTVLDIESQNTEVHSGQFYQKKTFEYVYKEEDKSFFDIQNKISYNLFALDSFSINPTTNNLYLEANHKIYLLNDGRAKKLTTYPEKMFPESNLVYEIYETTIGDIIIFEDAYFGHPTMLHIKSLNAE